MEILREMIRNKTADAVIREAAEKYYKENAVFMLAGIRSQMREEGEESLKKRNAKKKVWLQPYGFNPMASTLYVIPCDDSQAFLFYSQAMLFLSQAFLFYSQAM